jgi:hypothetical protein
MGVASYLRYIVGFVLSLEIIRLWLSNEPLSGFAITLSLVFVVLAFLFILKLVGITP